jgi:23S rRNA (pseudouridine1915-N3)-methyltransferase
MRLVLIAVGRARPGPERDLFDDYTGRIKTAGPSVSFGPLNLIEVESRKRLSGPELAQAEAQAILTALPTGAAIIALDERGKHLSSPDFSTKLAGFRDSGVSDLAFIIGGADGLHDSVRAKANLCLGLGTMTWPHMLVRPLIAEQIYRAITILSGHPYHRV